MEVATAIHRLTQTWPEDERSGMTSEITRAAILVPTNIAEAYDQNNVDEHAHFLSSARGSLARAETLLILAVDLQYAPPDSSAPCFSAIEEVRNMLDELRARVLESPKR
jgi:four helix bundle protein